MPSTFLVSRQNDGSITTGTTTFDDDGDVPFWWTRTGIIVKWSIFLAIVVGFMLWLVLGYMHAKRRINKGLKPLGYHRCLLGRAELARVDPAYGYPHATYTNYAPPGAGYYGMQPMPPPVYDPNRPPQYPGGPAPPPPMGGSKVDPEQGAGDYAPPSGPPPPASQQPQRTGASNNPFSDPPRL
ncbi:hypothetical protein LQW54_005956 [Pestalotiopsis sp. IQ-011]